MAQALRSSSGRTVCSTNCGVMVRMSPEALRTIMGMPLPTRSGVAMAPTSPRHSEYEVQQSVASYSSPARVMARSMSA